MKFYLCELKVNGCKNITKPIDLKFCNSTIKEKVNFESTNIKAIYGPNGAGKSAIVTAMHIYKRLICEGNGLNDSYFLNFVKESINKETKQLEVELAVLIYNSKDNTYLATFKHYIRFVLKNNNAIIDCEKIYKLTGNSIFEGKLKELICVEDGKIVFLDGVNDIITNKLYLESLNLLNKRSIVDIGLDTKKKKNERLKKYELALICFKLFAFNLIVSMEKEDLHTNYLKDKEFIEELMKSFNNMIDESFISEITEDDIFHLSVKGRDVIKAKDLDNYLSNVDKLTKFIKVFKPTLSYIEVDKKINNDEYYCNKVFHYGDLAIDIEFESTGIKKLVRTFNALLACTNGRIVFIDEFDANLHDVYFAKLVEFMKIYAKGQLCFTTHNLEPIEVLKNNSHSLDFLSNDSRVSSWTKDGNKSPMKKYVNGLIDYSPFNVHAIDFIDSLIDEDN